MYSFLLSTLLCWDLAATPRGQPLTVGAIEPQHLESLSAFTLPFDLVGDGVVLRNLRCNGQRGDFIFNTGCSYALVVE